MDILFNVVGTIAFVIVLYQVVNFILGFLGIKIQIKIKLSYKGNPL